MAANVCSCSCPQPNGHALLSSAALYHRYISRQSSVTSWIHRLIYCLLGLLSLDFFLLASGHSTFYLHHDPFIFYLRRHLLDHTGCLFLFPLYIAMAIQLDYILTVQNNNTEEPLGPVAGDLLVVNSQHLQLAMAKMQSMRSFSNVFAFLKFKFRTYCHLWTGTAQFRFPVRLVHLPPGLTSRTRFKLALLQRLTELIIQATITTSATVFFFSIPPSLLAMVLIEHRFRSDWLTAISTLPHLAADLLLIYIVCFHTLLLALFALQMVFLLCALLYHHGLDINRSLRYRLLHLTAAPWGLVLALANYRSEHAKLIKILLTSNHRLVSPIIFWLCLPNLACSIYFISLAYLTNLNVFTLSYFILAIAGQALLIPIATLLPEPVKVLYASQSTLYRAQMALRGRIWLRDKVKLLGCYEQVDSEVKFWFTFGPVAPIDDLWVFQTLILYTTYLMFCFKTFY